MFANWMFIQLQKDFSYQNIALPNSLTQLHFIILIDNPIQRKKNNDSI